MIVKNPLFGVNTQSEGSGWVSCEGLRADVDENGLDAIKVDKSYNRLGLGVLAYSSPAWRCKCFPGCETRY
jgi:hypothetical protein